MCTGRIARVRGRDRGLDRVGVDVRASRDRRRRRPASRAAYRMQFADATKLVGEVITSSPGPTPASSAARCRPAVPLETAVAWRVPTNDAKSLSKRRRNGPSPSVPERRASSTSSSSRAPTSGAESPITRVGAALTSERAPRSGSRGTRPRAARCRDVTAKNSAWILRVIGPGPISWSSTERIGVTSAAVPVKNTSSAW